MTWTFRHPTHGVEDEHRELGPELVVREMDSRHHRPERRVFAHVARLSLVQRQRHHVILASLAGAELRVLLHELPVNRSHRTLERVLHPAIGSGTRSGTTA